MINLNLIGYLIFSSLMILIIIVVGKSCYRNGNIFVESLIPDHLELCIQINKLLLVGYYLVNIGYSAVTLSFWLEIRNLAQLIEVLSIKMAIIIIILSVLHYFNIFILTTSIQKLITYN